MTTDNPHDAETQTERVVRLALRAGKWHAERDALAAQVEAAREAVTVCARIPEMYRHLRMDTPEDQERHERITSLADRIVRAARVALGMEAEIEQRGEEGDAGNG